MRPNIVLFGDSITEESFASGGWGASLANTYSRKDSSSKPPVATTIFFGANDAALLGGFRERHHVPLDEYKDNLRKIVAHLKECSPTMLIVLITPPPIDEERRLEYARATYGEEAMKLLDRTNENAGVYAKGCVEVGGELGIPSINIWSKMQETDGWQKKYLSDGLHLTAQGNAVVFEQVVRVFKEAWLHPEEMPYDFPHHSEIDGNNPHKAFQPLVSFPKFNNI
ncbi:hypothetical protein V6N13_077568 [Hibiscus sabdariffa]